ncbi:MAG: hypothetical protein LDL39_18085 [Magnetospirillum sp.]|nr:hypothetical protein [Magnetospirillum sp.]
MLSEDFASLLNTFDKVIKPSVEAECPRAIQASARVFQLNLAEAIARLREFEHSAAPRLPAPETDTVVHFKPRKRPQPRLAPDGGGDAA